MPIFHKFYTFLCTLSDSITLFPKKDRYALGTRLQNIALDFFVLIIRANYEQGLKRHALLREASIQLDLLKILLRISKDTRALAENHYLHLQLKLQEVGKMLGGWIKSTNTKNPA